MKINELLELAEYGCTCCPNAKESSYDEIIELSKRFAVIKNCDIDDLNITISWEKLKDEITKNFDIPV